MTRNYFRPPFSGGRRDDVRITATLVVLMVMSTSVGGQQQSTLLRQEVYCASNTIDLTSDTTYYMDDCNDSSVAVTFQHIYATELRNVTIVVNGGVVLPTVVLSFGIFTHLNISMSSIICDPSSHSNACRVVAPLLRVEHNFNNFNNNMNPVTFDTVTIRVAHCILHIVDTTGAYPGNHFGMLLQLLGSSLNNVEISIFNASIHAAVVSAFGDAASVAYLFQVASTQDARGIVFLISQSVISMFVSSRWNRVLKVTIGMVDSFASSSASDISISCTNNSTMSLIVDCTSRPGYVAACTTVSSDNSLIHISNIGSGSDANLTNVSVTSRDSAFTVDVQNNRTGPAVHVSAVILIEGTSASALRSLHVEVVGGSVLARATMYVSFLRFTQFNKMHHVSIVARHIQSQQSSYGAALGSASSRSTALVYISSVPFADQIIILVSDVTAVQSTLSGTIAEGTINSSVAVVTSDVVYLDAGLTNSLVEVVRCSLWADMRNGTLPQLLVDNVPYPLVLGSVSATVLRLYKTYAGMNLSASLVNCSLHAQMGFRVAPDVQMLFVSSTVTLMFALINCTACTFSAVHSSGYMVSMDFPKNSGQEMSVGNSLINLFNLTMVIVSFDIGSYMSKMALFQASFLAAKAGFFTLFRLPVAQSSISVHIANSTILYPLPSSSSSSAPLTEQRRLTAMIPTPFDVLAYYAPPQTIKSSDVLLSLNALESKESPAGSDLGQSSFYYPLHALVCAFGCDMRDTVVFVSGRQLAIGSLLGIVVGQSRLTGTRLQFDGVRVEFPVLQYQSSLIAGVTGTTPAAVFMAGVEPALQLNTGTILSVTSSEFVGFPLSSVFMVSSNVSWSPIKDAVATSDSPPAHVVLGCNLWNGAPMLSTLITATIDRHRVVYPRQTRWNTSVVCSGIVSTATVTRSPEMEVVVDILAMIPAISRSSAWTAGVSVAAALGATLGGGAAVAAVDSQVLGAMGSSVCASSALRVAAGPTRYTLSPFASLGPAAMIFGNVGLVLLFVALHMLVVCALQRRERHHSNADVALDSQGLSAEVRMQFPNHSITVSLLLVQGVVNAIASALFQGSVTLLLCGCLGIVAVSLGIFVRQRFLLSSTVAKAFVFERYRPDMRRSFPLSGWLLPLGRWGNDSLRATHGRLRGAVRGGAEQLSLFVVSVALTQNALLGLPVRTAWCGTLWGVLCAVTLVAAVVVVYCRPSRIPVVDVFTVVGYLLMCVVFVLNLLLTLTMKDNTPALAGDPSVTDGRVVMDPMRLLAGISTTTLLLTILTIVKGLHACLVVVWERRPTVSSSSACVVGGGSSASSSFDALFLKLPPHCTDEGDGERSEDLLLVSTAGAGRRAAVGEIKNDDEDGKKANSSMQRSENNFNVAEEIRGPIPSLEGYQRDQLAFLIEAACHRPHSNGLNNDE